jgi:spore maturation protein CgeB
LWIIGAGIDFISSGFLTFFASLEKYFKCLERSVPASPRNIAQRSMKLVIFGLTISSSWGNGHATIWRGLLRAFAARGHGIVFFERDVPYYAGCHRDLHTLEYGSLILYSDWESILPTIRMELAEADVAMVTSYCPDGRAAAEVVLSSPAELKTFYDLDTPVTLSRLDAGEDVSYVPANGLGDFDLVLSYTGGKALEALQTRLGARAVAPLYGSVDPAVHAPAAPRDIFDGDISYLGTYAADRQAKLCELFIEPARLYPEKKFIIGGAQYPAEFPWTNNIHFVRHLPPGDHPAFYCSSRLTLNITRKAMAEMGHCPSGRLFEAAACKTAILSDSWEGLEEFFTPGEEILIARNTAEANAALELTDTEIGRLAQAGYEKALSRHTATHRAEELERALVSGGITSGGGERVEGRELIGMRD